MQQTSSEIYRRLLVLRCRKRDRAAWEELIAAWERPLLFFLRRLIGSEQDALDVLQETWIKAMRNINSLRDPNRLGPWLYRIARRTALNHRRFEATYRAALEREAAARPAMDDDTEPFRADDAEQIANALSKLTLPHREVLTLYFLQDHSIDEVAAVLEAPAGTIKSRLYWAKQALKNALTRDETRL